MKKERDILKLLTEYNLLLYPHDKESRRFLRLPIANYGMDTHYIVDMQGNYYNVNPDYGLLDFLRNFDKCKNKRMVNIRYKE